MSQTKRVNKGSSLKYLCNENGIDMENVMAMGDSENDEAFLKRSRNEGGCWKC